MKKNRYPNYKQFLNEAEDKAEWVKKGVTKAKQIPGFDVTYNYDKETGELKAVKAIEMDLVDKRQQAKLLKDTSILASEAVIEYEKAVKLYVEAKKLADAATKDFNSKKSDLMSRMYKFLKRKDISSLDADDPKVEAKDMLGLIIETVNTYSNLTAKALRPAVVGEVIDYKAALEKLKVVYADQREVLLQIELAMEQSKEEKIIKRGSKSSEKFASAGSVRIEADARRHTEEDVDEMFDDLLDEGLISNVGNYLKDIYLKVRRLFSRIERNLEEAKRMVDELK